MSDFNTCAAICLKGPGQKYCKYSTYFPVRPYHTSQSTSIKKKTDSKHRCVVIMMAFVPRTAYGRRPGWEMLRKARVYSILCVALWKGREMLFQLEGYVGLCNPMFPKNKWIFKGLNVPKTVLWWKNILSILPKKSYFSKTNTLLLRSISLDLMTLAWFVSTDLLKHTKNFTKFYEFICILNNF